MTEMYFKKVDLNELKNEIRRYVKYLLIFSILSMAYLVIETVCFLPYEIEMMFLTVIAYLSIWAILTTQLIFDVIGCVFYQDDGDKSNDKVYL
jgi:hypothetical protein